MAEEKKRFPWWLVACAVVLAPLADALGVIETVGRQGTLLGKCERLTGGMTTAEVFAILGRPNAGTTDLVAFRGGPPSTRSDCVLMTWSDGPAVIGLYFSVENRTHFYKELCLDRVPSPPDFQLGDERSILWRIRRWAEQAYTAIHGPRH